jgi:hypothetical protein
MANGNGDYLLRFERVEKTLERIAQIQEVQARNLASPVEIQQAQAKCLHAQEEKHWEHEEMFRRIETGLAEATDKINFLIDREMKREAGPEAIG